MPNALMRQHSGVIAVIAIGLATCAPLFAHAREARAWFKNQNDGNLSANYGLPEADSEAVITCPAHGGDLEIGVEATSRTSPGKTTVRLIVDGRAFSLPAVKDQAEEDDAYTIARAPRGSPVVAALSHAKSISFAVADPSVSGWIRTDARDGVAASVAMACRRSG
jgi:hypothetical protein